MQAWSFLAILTTINGMIVPHISTTENWCESVENPQWPFAYQKTNNQTIETNGRINSNRQDTRHSCQIRGTKSKCHVCETFRCGENLEMECNYQLQGIEWAELPKNIPTTTDVPWGINGNYRYDYVTSDGICIFLSGGQCIIPSNETDYSTCKARCWGTDGGQLSYERTAATMDSWQYKDTIKGSAQGKVSTLAGSGRQGFANGDVETSSFSNPQGIAMDTDKNLYIADTDNHAIRLVNATTLIVSTIAGDGVRGYYDGPTKQARFSYPSAIAVMQAQDGSSIIYVSERGNHRIRKISKTTVSCVAGKCGQVPSSGLADGAKSVSAFNVPLGIAIDQLNNLIIADSQNHLLRYINTTDETTITLAGRVTTDRSAIDCVGVCLKGISGGIDGPLNQSSFTVPTGIAVELPNSFFVTDRHRIRRIIYTITQSPSTRVTGYVATVAGGAVGGDVDGDGFTSRFMNPTGIAVTKRGTIYTTSPTQCSVKAVTPSSVASLKIGCDTRFLDILIPQGCKAFNSPTNAHFETISSNVGHIQYEVSYNGRTEGNRTYAICTNPVPPVNLTIGNLSLENNISVTEPYSPATTFALYCPRDCGGTLTPVYGSDIYREDSSLCRAAIHSGLLDDSEGGLMQVRLVSWLSLSDAGTEFRLSSSRNNISSEAIDATTGVFSYFTVSHLNASSYKVQTLIGGIPSALGDQCGFENSLPPTKSKFNRPWGLTVSVEADLSASNLIYIADSSNHRIRSMTAICSFECENGGVCVGEDLCKCTAGWEGPDCTLPICSNPCGSRRICVGPNKCSCAPGYQGGNCDIPICVQDCHQGVCSAPDTCSCNVGWFDANCTTPVCSQTCGNGGQCTSHNNCTCLSGWQGSDCRTPHCRQTCANGGYCIAPDTCLCPAGWTGSDCSIPICTQGSFVPFPTASFWNSTVPCEYMDWCNKVSDFHCRQKNYTTTLLVKPETGSTLSHLPSKCYLIELNQSAITNFRYLTSEGLMTEIARYSGRQCFDSHDDGQPYSAITVEQPGYTGPWQYSCDREVAVVEQRSVVQGRYVCPNNGSCVAPGVCECNDGWSGFDCRTPICTQGYFADQSRNTINYDQWVIYGKTPPYSFTIENITADCVDRKTILQQNQPYFYIGGVPQGAYFCSLRSVTKWEKPLTYGPNASDEYLLEHPNYYSRYMDKTLLDGIVFTNWEGMDWPATYEKTEPVLDNTREGWRRGGIWRRIPGTGWEKGVCNIEYVRVCRNGTKNQLGQDIYWNISSDPVNDTDLAYRAKEIYTDLTMMVDGVMTNECVDHVIRGCFNNGTCTAPDNCVCSDGWKGYDCTIPICEQGCFNGGNCTLPNTCTCEKGWTGHNCSIAICAQECRNSGTCVAPDQCECVTRKSEWKDTRGEYLFQLPEGGTQRTGYTGYDCNTPICVQAERFVVNVLTGDSQRVELGGPISPNSCTTIRCPGYDKAIAANDGYSFQAGCSSVSPVSFQKNPPATQQQINNFFAANDSLNIDRSSSVLCGNLVWEEGEYAKDGSRQQRTNYRNLTKLLNGTWIESSLPVPGEGIYMCYNMGTCIAPDTCTCKDGFSGFDCSIPLCRFSGLNGEVIGCQHNSVCVEKDTCRCLQTQSLLHTLYPEARSGVTGWTGKDCSVPICLQGFYDPDCSNSEGCYRCNNGGTCVAPDLCACAEGWTGYDCSIPVCKLTVTEKIRQELRTVDEAKVFEFELDPCGAEGGGWGKELVNGVWMGQGNCTRPNLCTCLCRQIYDKDLCKKTGMYCNKPWNDPWKRTIPAGYIRGKKNCYSGFEGLEINGLFHSCHLQIYVPTFAENYSQSLAAGGSLLTIIGLWLYLRIRKYSKKRMLLAKAQRRRSKRNSEDHPLEQKPGAFEHQ